MKKLLSVLFALAMIVSLASVAMAMDYDPGNIYVKEDEDDDEYTEDKDELAPGEIGWIFLGYYDYDDGDNADDEKDSREKPHSISIKEGTFVANDDDGDDYKANKLISIASKAEKKKIDSSKAKYGWFAKLTVKSISASKYPEDGYDIDDGLVIEYDWDYEDRTNKRVPVNLTAITYEDSDDEFEDSAKLYSYDKDDDVDIDLPDDDGSFIGVARKNFDVVASMNTKVNNSLLNKYPNADIRFYNGNGANFPVSNGKLKIKGNSGDHCYQVGSNGELIDKSSTWSSSENAFVIKTTIIGKYIVSDTKLSTTVKTEDESTKPTINEYIGTVAPGTNLSAPVGSRTYTVVAGDSLWGIAQKQLGNGWRYNEIVQLNGLKNNFIYSGQVLTLPN